MRHGDQRNKLEREHSPKHNGHKEDVDGDEETVIGEDPIGLRSTVPELGVLSMKRRVA